MAPLSVGFSRQGYWSGLLCLPCRGLKALRKLTQVCAHTHTHTETGLNGVGPGFREAVFVTTLKSQGYYFGF